MDRDVTKVDRMLKIPCKPKVHDAICCELLKVLKRISCILPAIESAQPGSSSGIQVLCSLNNSVEKSKLLIHYCSESSTLYLALTSESIALRCERIRTQLIQCFCQIQTMVPTPLASQIAKFLDYLSDVKFIINPKEEEAGKVLLNLLAQINSKEDEEFEAFRNVTSRLRITSSIALLVERRAIKRLLDKFRDVDKKKERILMYFLYLIKTHGKQLMPHSVENKERENANMPNNCLNERTNSESDACMIGDNAQPPNNVEFQSELFDGEIPPEEYYCPISSNIMFDPVVIASGETYERIFIEKWFREGHDTCPKTQKKLENFSIVPNSCMKDHISIWCKKHGVIIQNPCNQLDELNIKPLESIHCNSVSSLKNISTALLDGTKGDYCLLESVRNISSLTSSSCCSSESSNVKDVESSSNNYVQLFSWSDDYQKYQSFSKFSHDMYLRFLFRLSELPTLLQVKAVEGIKNMLESEDCCLFSSGFAEALMIFLKKVCSLSDLPRQRCGAQILLALFANPRWDLNFKIEDTVQLLSSFLNCGIDKEALMVLQKVALHPDYLRFIITSDIPFKVLKFLNSENIECMEIAMKLLSQLSSDGEMKYHFLSSGCIEKISQLLSNKNLVRFSLNILKNLAADEEASMQIVDAQGCIASIAEVLEFGKPEQELAVTILLSLCSRSSRYCLLVLKEGVIPSLVGISVNGSAKGKENSMKLLHVLRDIRHIDCLDSPQSYSEPGPVLVEHPLKKSKRPESKYRYFGFFSRKVKMISRSLAFF